MLTDNLQSKKLTLSIRESLASDCSTTSYAVRWYMRSTLDDPRYFLVTPWMIQGVIDGGMWLMIKVPDTHLY